MVEPDEERIDGSRSGLFPQPEDGQEGFRPRT